MSDHTSPCIGAPSSIPRTVLADDHAIVLEAIRGVLGIHVQVVATAKSGAGLLAAVIQEAPDLIIADLEMAEGTGLDILRHLRARGDRTHFVILSMHAQPSIVAACLRAGANGYVLKTSAGEELLGAVASVMRGDLYTPASFIEMTTIDYIGQPIQLTPRLLEVLELMGIGRSTKEISQELGLSPRTVESHKSALMRRLQVATSLELVRQAADLGLTRQLPKAQI